jgi:predicted transposase YdaD
LPLISLIGLTRIDHPEQVLPETVQLMRTVPDEQERARLFTSLVALLPDEELTEMAEKILESDVLLLDTPFLRRIRNQGIDEGVQIGRQEGVQIGRQEGVQIGRQEGVQTIRRTILDAAVHRFNLLAVELWKLEAVLARIANPDGLRAVLLGVVESADFPTLLHLAEETAGTITANGDN